MSDRNLQNTPGSSSHSESNASPPVAPAEAVALPPSTAPRTEQSWPSFLDCLETDPDKAWTEFAAFAAMTLRSLTQLRMRPTDSRQYWIDQIVLHCCQDGFKRLRKYRNTGGTFAAWLRTVAVHYLFDHPSEPPHDPLGEDQPAPGPPSSHDEVYRRFLQAVLLAMERLDERCRLLLKLVAEGYKPREIVTVLKLSREQNVAISERIRACRVRLACILLESGFDVRTAWV